MQAVADQPYRNEPDLAVIEAIILALECRVPIERFRGLQRHAMLGDVRRILGGIEFDFHRNFVHPLNGAYNDFRAPEKESPG